MVIGVTGIIGSGKSAVGKLLSKRGFEVVEADELAREVVLPGSKTLAMLIGVFGAEFLESNGALNRRKLGEVVFRDQAKRKKLESILHPTIRALWREKLAKLSGKNVAYIVPLLFESGEEYQELEKKILVAADRNVCLARIMARDKLSAEQAAARLDSQMPIEQKLKLADLVVWNNASETELAGAVDSMLAGLLPK